MGYTIPLKFIRVSDKMSICATRIMCIIDAACTQGKRILKEERDSQTLLRADPARAAKSLIVLDNGTVISSPYTVGKVLTNINAAGVRDRRRRIPIKDAISVYTEDPNVDYKITGEIEAVGEKAEALYVDEEENLEEDEELIKDILNVEWDGDAR